MKEFRDWSAKALLAGIFTAAASVCSAQDSWNPPPNTIPENYYYSAGPLSPISMSPVQVRLMLVFDASSSMNGEEYRVQVNGAANALTSDAVKDSWFGPSEERVSGPVESVAISVLVFDSHGRLRVPWVDFRRDDPNLDERLELFANEIRGLAETRITANNGATSIGEALALSAAVFENAPWQSTARDVIDLSGDGENNDGRTIESIKPLLASMDITINGLAIVNEEASLDYYYRTNLITRLDEDTDATLGNVWVVARNMEDESGDGSNYLYFQERFERALREKLVWEVAGLNIDDIPYDTEHALQVTPHLNTYASILPAAYNPD